MSYIIKFTFYLKKVNLLGKNMKRIMQLTGLLLMLFILSATMATADCKTEDRTNTWTGECIKKYDISGNTQIKLDTGNQEVTIGVTERHFDMIKIGGQYKYTKIYRENKIIYKLKKL